MKRSHFYERRTVCVFPLGSEQRPSLWLELPLVPQGVDDIARAPQGEDDIAVVPAMVRLNSKWGPGGQRQSTKLTVEHTRQVRDRHGTFRAQTENVTEAAYVARVTAKQPGWFRGAKVAK